MSDELPPLPTGFKAAVVRELEAAGYDLVGWSANGLSYTTADGTEHQLGLANLARRVQAADPAEMDGIVRQFFQAATSVGTTHELPEKLADVADKILPRVGKPFDISDEANPWSMPLEGTDLAAHLVIDFPDSMAFVPPKMVDDTADWLEIARQNLKARTPADWLQPLPDTNGIMVGHINDSYDAARALVLADLYPEPAAGWLVCVPARDVLFAVEVSAERTQVFHLLKILAESNFARMAYPVSDQVYWVRADGWEAFRIELSEDRAEVYPSERFLAAIGYSPEESGDSEAS